MCNKVVAAVMATPLFALDLYAVMPVLITMGVAYEFPWLQVKASISKTSSVLLVSCLTVHDGATRPRQPIGTVFVWPKASTMLPKGESSRKNCYPSKRLLYKSRQHLFRQFFTSSERNKIFFITKTESAINYTCSLGQYWGKSSIRRQARSVITLSEIFNKRD